VSPKLAAVQRVAGVKSSMSVPFPRSDVRKDVRCGADQVPPPSHDTRTSTKLSGAAVVPFDWMRTSTEIIEFVNGLNPKLSRIAESETFWLTKRFPSLRARPVLPPTQRVGRSTRSEVRFLVIAAFVKGGTMGSSTMIAGL